MLNFITTYHKAAFFFALILLPTATLAQETARYKVELILFAELNPTAPSAEHWREVTQIPPGEDTDAVHLAIGNDQVQPLDASAYRLSGIWSALKRSSAYRPLRHLAWVQPGRSAKRAPVVAIGDNAEDEIQGTVKVSLARFLHLDLNLVLRDGDQKYQLQQSRRMRSNELHYIDHPMFGVIVIITPVTQ